MSDWEDFNEIFGLTNEICSEAQESTLAVDSTWQYLCIEITIALPQKHKEYRNLTLHEKMNVYENMWENLKAEYNAQSGAYAIEYHDNGFPHIHGYLHVKLHPNTFNYETKEILKMFAKSVFLKAPRSLYKQFINAEINEYLRRFKSPLVTLNIKNYLSKEWVNYMEKNA